MGTVPFGSVLAPPPLGVKLKNPVLQIGLLILPRSYAAKWTDLPIVFGRWDSLRIGNP
jgi:hypothetical protein